MILFLSGLALGFILGVIAIVAVAYYVDKNDAWRK
jgi:hypothetical protein